jgi:hypothetical protein
VASVNGSAVGVSGLPEPTQLHPNDPNPFNPLTRIQFELAQAGEAELTAYDLGGRSVRHLLHEPLPVGHYELEWNGCDDRGQAVSSGVSS